MSETKKVKDDLALHRIIKKGLDMKHLEEEGRLIILPCKEDDILYCVGSKCLANMVTDIQCAAMYDCDDCKYDKEYIVFTKQATKSLLCALIFNTNENFIYGKNVFSNEKDAQKALKVKLGENNG